MTATTITSTTATALPARESERVAHYVRASRADQTWAAYRRAVRHFAAWYAERTPEPPIPAAMSVVREYVAWMADHGYALATINQHVSALASAHRLDGHPFDRAQFAVALKGIRRERGKPQRQARPLVTDDVRGILSDFPLGKPSGARDAALLTLGFAGALRRSELVGLDWQKLGTGAGVVERDARGIVITLLHSKGRDGEPETVICPCVDMPTACEALDRWVKLAGLEPGAPVFRPITKGERIGPDRLTDRSVARIIKARVRARALATGKSKAEADQLAAKFSGHSLRAGYATAAAMLGVPEWKIRKRTRHRTAELVARYVRAAEEWTDSGLKGVGF
jgi:integrase